MEEMGRYILSVIAAAFVLGILLSMVDQKGSTGALLRLIGGLFLTFTVLTPVVNFDYSPIREYWKEFSAEGEYACTNGEEMADRAYRTLIKEQVEAYILDKADELGLHVAVDVTLGEGGIPVSAVFRGSASPGAKAKLQKILEEELQISKEDQQWIGQP